MSGAPCIDLTVRRPAPAREGFSDDEDEAAFGIHVARAARPLWQQKIWHLKHNDPNFGLLDLAGVELSDDMCARIGVYLSASQHLKTLRLRGVTATMIANLFGKIAGQNETNDYVLKANFLGQIVGNEQTLVDDIIGRLTSFTHLRNVLVSGDDIGLSGGEALVRALAGSPVEDLSISGNLDGIAPLEGLRKCERLKNLDISGNRIRLDDFVALSVLFDNGNPRLRQLRLQNCGIGDDLIETISPMLKKNRTLKELFLCNNSEKYEGNMNLIGERGFESLLTAVHDTSSFANLLASNHTIFKFILDHYGANPEGLFKITHMHHGNDGTDDRVNRRVGWEKYIQHFLENKDADMSPFLDTDTNLVPHVLARVSRTWAKFTSSDVIYDTDSYDGDTMRVLYKIWSCKPFRERVNMASQIHRLQTENDGLMARMEELVSSNSRNERLKIENARLVAENKKLKEDMTRLRTRCTEPTSSIAERMLMRKRARKRGRN